MLCSGASANAGAANQPETMQFNSLQRVAANRGSNGYAMGYDKHHLSRAGINAHHAQT